MEYEKNLYIQTYVYTLGLTGRDKYRVTHYLTADNRPTNHKVTRYPAACDREPTAYCLISG